MSALSPADKQEPGVMRTRLTWDESGQTTRKVAQRPEKTMKKPTPVPDLLPNTDWKPGNRSPRGLRWGRTAFSQISQWPTRVSNTMSSSKKEIPSFPHVSSVLRPLQGGQKGRKQLHPSE